MCQLKVKPYTKRIEYTHLINKEINGLILLSIDAPILLRSGKWEPMFTLECKCGSIFKANRHQLFYGKKKTCGGCRVGIITSPDFKIYKEYENYRVYKSGVVTSLSYIRKGRIFHKEREIKHGSNKGYPFVTLFNSYGEPKPFLLHRLLGELYIPNPENKPEINHKNGIRSDYRIENLEWVTHSENIQHAYDTGLAAPWNKGIKKYDWRTCFCGNTFYPKKTTQSTCSKSCSRTLVIKNKGWYRKHSIILPH